MKSNQLKVLALLLFATAGISANNTNYNADAVQKALNKANEIMNTGKGSLTEEESAMLTAAGISYTKITETVPTAQNTVQQAPAKAQNSTKHDLVVASLLCQFFGRLFS